MAELTGKEKKFCQDYLVTGNATESYVTIYGINGNTRRQLNNKASKLIQKQACKAYIETLVNSSKMNKVAKASEVLEFLTEIMRGHVYEEVLGIGSDEKGRMHSKIYKKKVGIKEQIRAAELLGKRHMLFTDRLQVETNTQVNIVDDITEIDIAKSKAISVTPEEVVSKESGVVND